MREISLAEAEAVGGAQGVPGAIAGAAAGATAYIGTVAGGGKFNTGDFLGATATGAVAGALTGPVGIVKTLTRAGASYGAGIIGGGISREINAG
jgi:hypothetical protein